MFKNNPKLLQDVVVTTSQTLGFLGGTTLFMKLTKSEDYLGKTVNMIFMFPWALLIGGGIGTVCGDVARKAIVSWNKTCKIKH
jgi:hypothetical protein